MKKECDAIRVVLKGIYRGVDPPLIESLIRCQLIREASLMSPPPCSTPPLSFFLPSNTSLSLHLYVSLLTMLCPSPHLTLPDFISHLLFIFTITSPFTFFTITSLQYPSPQPISSQPSPSFHHHHPLILHLIYYHLTPLRFILFISSSSFIFISHLYPSLQPTSSQRSPFHFPLHPTLQHHLTLPHLKPHTLPTLPQ